MKKSRLLFSALMITALLTPLPLAVSAAAQPAGVFLETDLDSDADGVLDSADNCITVANPDQADADLDDVGDLCDAFPQDPLEWMDADADLVGDNADNCLATANLDQADVDLDGIGDACDAFPADPLETTDTDMDGVGDNGDNCLTVPNPDQADADQDGRGDLCDAFPQDPLEWADRDSDLIGDGADNCVDAANPDQLDADADGKGDVCDAFPADPLESADTDADGVGDNSDNCPAAANPDQADENQDGIGDACAETEEAACNEMAKRISEGVTTLQAEGFAEQAYTCEDIQALFEGGLTGSQFGYGRMWHAVQLADAFGGPVWEVILDWSLQNGGWGQLTQLYRLSEAMEDTELQDVLDLMDEGYTAKDILQAGRLATRYDAPLADVLDQLGAGDLSMGGLSQIYRMANETGVDPAALGDWIAQGNSVADIRQALRLADGDSTAEEILAIGVQEFRRQSHEKEIGKPAQDDGDGNKTAERLARMFDKSVDEILEAYNGQCQQEWGCTSKLFREMTREARPHGKKP
jgi:hypothetical protein